MVWKFQVVKMIFTNYAVMITFCPLHHSLAFLKEIIVPMYITCKMRVHQGFCGVYNLISIVVYLRLTDPREVLATLENKEIYIVR